MTGKAYYFGQIKQDSRGDLAVVVTKGTDATKYDAFLYGINSEELRILTGVREVTFPTERVYIGVSHDAGEKLLREVNDGRGFSFTDLDNIVVTSQFLRNKD